VLPRRSLSQLLRRRGVGQLKCSVCHSGRGGVAVSGNLHRREGEFDAIGPPRSRSAPRISKMSILAQRMAMRRRSFRRECRAPLAGRHKQ
jgi:hypothetical protein